MKIAFLGSTMKYGAQEVIHHLEQCGHEVKTPLSAGFYAVVPSVAPSPEDFSQYDLGISWFYRHILKQEHIDAFKYGVINNHIAYLPDGRGAMPNVWSLVDHFQPGVTIHWIDKGVDTGPIIAQARVPKYITDRGETLYQRLVEAMLHLFLSQWGNIQYMLEFPVGSKGTPQTQDGYKTYRVKDVEKIDDLENYFGFETAHEFVDILRARTFTGWDGAYIRDENGEKVYIKIQLEYRKDHNAP
jgi:methionyl-tRNA formyltransferase